MAEVYGCARQAKVAHNQTQKEEAEPAATAQRLDRASFEFEVASSAWLTRDRWAKHMHACVLVADDGEIYELLNHFARYDDDEEKPEARWDYFGIGGQFEGALPLKKRRLRRLLGVIPVGWSDGASIARKWEVDCERFLTDPPVGLYFRGQLHMCPLTLTDDEVIGTWQKKFRLLFAEIPDDATLRIIDAHS